jgi:hypothetical protein
MRRRNGGLSRVSFDSNWTWKAEISSSLIGIRIGGVTSLEIDELSLEIPQRVLDTVFRMSIIRNIQTSQRIYYKYLLCLYSVSSVLILLSYVRSVLLCNQLVEQLICRKIYSSMP